MKTTPDPVRAALATWILAESSRAQAAISCDAIYRSGGLAELALALERFARASEQDRSIDLLIAAMRAAAPCGST